MPLTRRRRSRGAPTRRRPTSLAFFLLVLVAAAYGLYVVRQASVRHAAAPVAPQAHASGAPAGPLGGLASAAPGISASPLPLQPAPSASLGPRLAIIIDDCGYSMDRDGAFLPLPIPLTLSVLPMTPHGPEIVAAAQAAGKAVMLHLPMQPQSSAANPGPGVIRTDMSDDMVRRQVEADIDSLPPLPGVNNHMGSKATSDPRVMRDVLEVVKQKKMFFVDSLTSPVSVGDATARELGIPSAQRSVFLDNVVETPAIEARLREAEQVALRRGTAIAIGHPNPQTRAALAALIPEIEAAGVTFVPAADLVKAPK